MGQTGVRVSRQPAQRLPRVYRRRAMVAVMLFGAVALASGYAGRESGGVVTKQLDIRGFDRVSVPGSWDVEVAEGPFAVSVTVDSHLEDDLRVERRGDALVFRLRAGLRLRRVRTLQASVTMPALSGAEVSGSGSIRFAGFGRREQRGLQFSVSGSGHIHGSGCSGRDFHARVSGSGTVELGDCAMQTADVVVTGSGDVVLSGGRACRARDLALSISGSGTARLDGCVFENAEVSLSGSGDAVLALGGGNLTGSLSGSGSLDYRGNPRVMDVRTSGSGSVRKSG